MCARTAGLPAPLSLTSPLPLPRVLRVVYAALPPALSALPAGVALLVLGSICFLPGFYHTRIAYMAWRGIAGFSLDDIPDL